MSVEGHEEHIPAAVNQRKRLAFLALLAASGRHGIARERILLLLWPDSTTDRARGALYQLLYVVRQAFGEESVVGTEELRLDPNIVDSDVSDYNEALARGDLATAVDLYAGPFLDAYHLPGTPELERWIEQKRQELARSYQSALARLAALAMDRRDNSAAVAFAERLVAADPLSERATVLLMEALATSGDVTTALERARIHASIVRQELDADVGTSVSALAARLRSESTAVAARPAVAKSGNSDSTDLARAVAVAAPPPPTNPPRSRRTRAFVRATAVVIVGIAVIVAMRPARNQGKEFVVVADFETAVADSQIADWLTEATRRALSASRSLGAAPDVRVLAARQRLHVPPTARLTLNAARQVAIGDGIRGVVSGSLKSFGGGYAMSLRLVSAPSGEVLANVYQAGIATSQLFMVLDTLTRQLREAAGDDLEAIRAQPSLLALTSASLEAMTDYVTALRLPRDSGARAVALLQEAVALDTSFASALWQLSRFIERAGRRSDAEHRELLARAWNHREGLTDYEQLRVEIAYKYSSNGTTPNIVEHLERLRQIVERYPNAVDAGILADMYLGRRDLAAAERAYRLAIALDSTRAEAYVGIVSTDLKANRIRDARRAADELTRKFPSSGSAEIWDAVVSYAEGRRDRTREILRRMAASTGPSRTMGSFQGASLDLLEGRVAAWERVIRAADSLSDARPTGPLPLARLGAKYWVVDRPEQGLALLESALAANASLRLGLDAAELYAQFGRPDSARALVAARGVRDQTVYSKGADTLPASAWIDLAEGRPRDAARKFRESLRFSGANAPSQVRLDAETGLAFERAGLPDSAIATYEHYLNAVPSWESDALKLVWILEHVAPLYEKKGDRRKAGAAYARVAELWKSADPELQPRVSRARERAAALR